MPKNRFLFFVIALFIVFDVLLFFLYFRLSRNTTPSQKTTTGGTNTKTVSNITVLPGDDKSLSRVKIDGTIEEEPIFNRYTKQYEMLVSFLGKANNILVPVSLGREKYMILSLIADKDKGLPTTQIWRIQPVEILIPYLKKGASITLYLAYQQPGDIKKINELLNRPDCTSLCKTDLNQIKNFLPSNNYLVNELKGEAPEKKDLKVGAVEDILIFK